MSLIVRQHSENGRDSKAVYSACETYRYALTRTWAADQPRLLYIMLNPSKATELANDPTIERCERRAHALGYGGFRVCNLFALRETDPARLKKAPHPVGPDNTDQLRAALAWTDDVLCAWGVHGAHQNQGDAVANLVRNASRPVLCLGVTKDGHPRHPLYISYKTLPEPWV